MADPSLPPSSGTPAKPAPAAPPAPTGPTIRIGEEFGTAKKNLPPARIVLITIAAVVVVVAIVSFLKRAKPLGAGSLDNVAAVDIPGQNSTMVALTFTLHNTSQNSLNVASLKGTMKDSKGATLTADAVSAVDFARYFQVFPALKNGAQPPLSPEAKIPSGQSVTSTIIVVFPVPLDTFNQRQSLSAVIWPYDQQVPVVLTK
jgi:hypothetical protein